MPENKHEQELIALNELTKNLPDKTATEFIELWQEFEAGQTLEAKFAIALDKLEVLIQHNQAAIETWEEKEYEFNYVYAYDKVDFSQVLTLFRDLILEETLEKIDQEIEG